MVIFIRGVKSFAIFSHVLVCGAYIMWQKQLKLWKGYLLSLVVLWELVRWHIVYCFTLCLIWKPNWWTCNRVKFGNFWFKSLDWAVTPQKQPKTFVVRKLKAQLITGIRWFKKFRLGCKNLNDLEKSSRPKSVDSEVFSSVIEANPTSSSRRTSG